VCVCVCVCVCSWLLLCILVIGFHQKVHYHLSHTPSHFCFSYFWVGSPVFAQSSLHGDPIYISCISGMTGGHHHTCHPIGWDGGPAIFLPLRASNHDPPNLCLQSSWEYRQLQLDSGSEILFLHITRNHREKMRWHANLYFRQNKDKSFLHLKGRNRQHYWANSWQAMYHFQI
jgi:hypothetical protein